MSTEPSRPDVSPSTDAQVNDEQHLIERLRQGDETTFTWLQTEYTAMMLRLAHMYVADWATAEDVVQDTWLAVFQNIDRFEGRSSLKTWIFHILMNKARTRAKREQRVTAFSLMWSEEIEFIDPGIDERLFNAQDGHWTSFPGPWPVGPEDQALSGELRDLILRVIKGLPMNQMEVITLRDVEGFTPAEVCELMELTDANQRVILHRARTAVRRAIEVYFNAG